MKIITELKGKIFSQISWYSKELDEWRGVNVGLLSQIGQKDSQRVFLSALAEEIRGKIPDYRFISPIKLNAIQAFSPEDRAEGPWDNT